MHGRVVAVAVLAGAHVELGDPLFSLEAMKMEHSVLAPLAGQVKMVRIAPGQQLQGGMVALLIEPDPVN
jgi:biotin carboxyl carrier protein